MYSLLFLTQAQRDAKKLSASGLKPKLLELLQLIQQNPFAYPPAFEYLKGDMKGLISRLINKQHRLVYEVIEEEKLIRIYCVWTHYE